ncbi:MAG: tRNA (adenosine(37)-N6)-threonylcarbamoyltransferase complex dimerization subunit type 1 TsaB [Actinomycetota bacterium]
MIVLGIETSTPASSVSLWSHEGRIAGTTLSRGRTHVEFLMPAILSMSSTADVPLSRLTGIAVGLGPGLFTGMRVGIATAKTLAQVLRIPIVGISSLDLLAFSVRYTQKVICACVDARRGEVFAAFYRQAPGGIVRLSDYAAWKPDELASEVVARDDDVLFVGNGALAYGADLGEVGEVAGGATQYPRAEALCELSAPRFEREETTPVALLEPLYVRRSDAEINWERRGVTILRPGRVRIPKKALER